MKRAVLAATAASASSVGAAGQPDPDRKSKTAGPLRVHPKNGRYFGDRNGKAVYLTGSHLGWELQDDAWDRKLTFDFGAYLDLLGRHHHNLIRLWVVEHTRTSNPKVATRANPMPFERTGPGKAQDDGLKFDLTKFNDAFFSRIRRRVEAAGRRGIYVMVMLFQGWSLRRHKRNDPWFGHYLNPANNVNHIDASAEAVHALVNPAVTAVQEAYVRKVIDAVGDLDNVLYEIANESLGSKEWHEHMVGLIKSQERRRTLQHPVVLSGCRRGLTNRDLFASRADAIGVSRDPRDDYLSNPPAADGRRVIIADSDHIDPHVKDPAYVWKNFFRGANPLVLDWGLIEPADESWAPIRRAMGQSRLLADRVDLASLAPRGELASTDYCLADPGTEYLVYVPPGADAVRVDLSAAKGKLRVEWISTTDGRTRRGDEIPAGARPRFHSPFRGASVLHLRIGRPSPVRR